MVLRTKQLSPNGAACPITADDIFCLRAICSIGSINIHPRLVLILTDLHDTVRPLHLRRRLPLDMLVQKLPKTIKRQNLHLVRIVIGKNIEDHACNEGRVHLAPGKALRGYAACLDIVEDPGSVELVSGW